MKKAICAGLVLVVGAWVGVQDGAFAQGKSRSKARTKAARHAPSRQAAELAENTLPQKQASQTARGANDPGGKSVDAIETEHEAAHAQAESTPAGQNATSAEIANKTPSRWSGSFESRNEFVTSTVLRGDQGYGVTNDTMFLMRARYKVNDSFQVGAGYDLDHNLFLADKPGEQRPFDTYEEEPFIEALFPKIGTLPGNVGVAVNLRGYVPISQYDQNAGLVATRAELFLTKDVKSWSFSYIGSARPYFNSRTTYVYMNPDNTTKTKTTPAFRLVQMVEALYKFNDHWSVYQDVGVDDQIFNGGNFQGTDIPGAEKSYEVLETGINFAPNQRYRLTSGLSSYEHNYRTTGLTFYGPETRYFLSGAVSF